jgi:hypothetical protein
MQALFCAGFKLNTKSLNTNLIKIFRAENSIGRFETKARLIVLPVEKKKKSPEFTQPLQDKTELEGNVAVFEVTVDAEPKAQLKWTLNGETITENDVSFCIKL